MASYRLNKEKSYDLEKLMRLYERVERRRVQKKSLEERAIIEKKGLLERILSKFYKTTS
ncbi:MAG: hypothetical protein ABIB71_08630 [Candidatus Woesearchaeota archaeon]